MTTPPDLLAGCGLGFTLSCGTAYALINLLPFDSYTIAWEPIQTLYFCLYYLALALPFLFAGTVAVVGAEATVAILQSQVFELPVRLHPWLWLLGPVIGSVLILIVGTLGTRGLISTPPVMVLRGLD